MPNYEHQSLGDMSYNTNDGINSRQSYGNSNNSKYNKKIRKYNRKKKEEKRK